MNQTHFSAQSLQPLCVIVKLMSHNLSPTCSSRRSGPPGGPTADHGEPDVAGGADTLRDVDPALLGHSATVLGGGAARAAATTTPAAPSPAAPRRCSTAHPHLEASERQVASNYSYLDSQKGVKRQQRSPPPMSHLL